MPISYNDLLVLPESDIVRLVLSFLERSGLTASVSALEREAGVTARECPEFGRRLRALLQQGRWEEASEAVRNVDHENARRALWEIAQQKYLEKEPNDDAPSEQSKLGNGEKEPKRLQEARIRNTLTSRTECFDRIWTLLGHECEEDPLSGRLIALLAKGLLYEACEEFCRQKTSLRSEGGVAFAFGSLTHPPSHPEPRLHAWLQTVPWLAMAKGFVHRPLTVQVTRMKRPEGDGDLRETESRDGSTPDILKRAEELVHRWKNKNGDRAFGPDAQKTRRDALSPELGMRKEPLPGTVPSGFGPSGDASSREDFDYLDENEEESVSTVSDCKSNEESQPLETKFFQVSADCEKLVQTAKECAATGLDANIGNLWQNAECEEESFGKRKQRVAQLLKTRGESRQSLLQILTGDKHI